jgi:multicomponent K+:H+ antiporter subunit E
MTRRLPFALLWVSLLAMWLALNQTIALAHVLIGACVATAAVRSLAVLGAPRRRLAKFRCALALVAVVLADVVRSNLAVAAIVLHPRTRARTSGFVSIPLQLRDPAGLAVLACIITSTPGTAWAGYDASSGILTMHVLDLVDEAGWRRVIQGRYERRLREIFE